MWELAVPPGRSAEPHAFDSHTKRKLSGRQCENTCYRCASIILDDPLDELDSCFAHAMLLPSDGVHDVQVMCAANLQAISQDAGQCRHIKAASGTSVLHT
jgi:hypothetical protein